MHVPYFVRVGTAGLLRMALWRGVVVRRCELSAHDDTGHHLLHTTHLAAQVSSLHICLHLHY